MAGQEDGSPEPMVAQPLAAGSDSLLSSGTSPQQLQDLLGGGAYVPLSLSPSLASPLLPAPPLVGRLADGLGLSVCGVADRRFRMSRYRLITRRGRRATGAAAWWSRRWRSRAARAASGRAAGAGRRRSRARRTTAPTATAASLCGRPPQRTRCAETEPGTAHLCWIRESGFPRVLTPVLEALERESSAPNGFYFSLPRQARSAAAQTFSCCVELELGLGVLPHKLRAERRRHQLRLGCHDQIILPVPTPHG